MRNSTWRIGAPSSRTCSATLLSGSPSCRRHRVPRSSYHRSSISMTDKPCSTTDGASRTRPVIERDCGGEDIPTFSDFLRRFGPDSVTIVDLESRQVTSVRCGDEVGELTRARSVSGFSRRGRAQRRGPELCAASTRGPSKASPARTIVPSASTQQGSGHGDRGVANRHFFTCASATCASPSHGRTNSVNAARRSSRSSSQCASLQAAEACTVIAGVELTPLAWLSAMKLMSACRSLEPARGGDRWVGVERGQERDGSVVVGSDQRLVEFDSRVDEQRECLRERGGDDRRRRRRMSCRHRSRPASAGASAPIGGRADGERHRRTTHIEAVGQVLGQRVHAGHRNVSRMTVVGVEPVRPGGDETPSRSSRRPGVGTRGCER